MAGTSSTQLFDCMGSLHSHPFLWTNISFWTVWKLTCSIYIKHHSYFFSPPLIKSKGAQVVRRGTLSLPNRGLCAPSPQWTRLLQPYKSHTEKSNLEAKNLKNGQLFVLYALTLHSSLKAIQESVPSFPSSQPSGYRKQETPTQSNHCLPTLMLDYASLQGHFRGNSVPYITCERIYSQITEAPMMGRAFPWQRKGQFLQDSTAISSTSPARLWMLQNSAQLLRKTVPGIRQTVISFFSEEKGKKGKYSLLSQTLFH